MLKTSQKSVLLNHRFNTNLLRFRSLSLDDRRNTRLSATVCTLDVKMGTMGTTQGPRLKEVLLTSEMFLLLSTVL